MADFSASTGAPASPPAPNSVTANDGQSSGVELTPKGEAYAIAHETRGAVPPGYSRQAIEDQIEQLIAVLDALDSDPDLEPDVDDEPSVGGNALNFEALDCELDDADSEPSLGSRNPSTPYVEALGFWRVRPYWITEADWAADLRRHNDVWSPRVDCQTNWATGCNDDREDEHDGAEPENEHGTDLDAGESDELENGEGDDSEGGGPSWAETVDQTVLQVPL